MEHQSGEYKDFIVEDGYKHDEDPSYVPEEEESSFKTINMLLEVKILKN